MARLVSRRRRRTHKSRYHLIRVVSAVCSQCFVIKLCRLDDELCFWKVHRSYLFLLASDLRQSNPLVTVNNFALDQAASNHRIDDIFLDRSEREDPFANLGVVSRAKTSTTRSQPINPHTFRHLLYHFRQLFFLLLSQVLGCHLSLAFCVCLVCFNKGSIAGFC